MQNAKATAKGCTSLLPLSEFESGIEKPRANDRQADVVYIMFVVGPTFIHNFTQEFHFIFIIDIKQKQ
jgi:hypothetical protein